MQSNPTALNPFSLMMEPEAVIQAMERSTALRSLRRHQLRPLDKPLIPYSSTRINPMREVLDDEQPVVRQVRPDAMGLGH
ncbi:hypothetical protein AZ34_17215 [Hylemonella gracilis str. Niagara R]|uniref:Uncharacterized protein n=1 Tax=Hylemonella gracilis str. Niagara R TaxID=1458275 RepID=A0A016XM48_9BURK|nr:hypothetical protein [Hylemonella gracilis]EYC52632.1 hypothetical protein AZ34_17215 [Hylemonella gracilis str. Niagara R]